MAFIYILGGDLGFIEMDGSFVDKMCEFIDNEVVIQWEWGQEELNMYLMEVGLSKNLLLVGGRGECTLNRAMITPTNIKSVVEHLQLHFNHLVADLWAVQFERDPKTLLNS